MLGIIISIIALVAFGCYILFLSEWGIDYYDIPDSSYVHTSLWDIIVKKIQRTKTVKKNYPLKSLRQKVKELHILDEIEEDAEFFDDDLAYCLLADRLDLLVKKNEIVGAILYASWYALEKGEQPGACTEVQNIKIQLSAVVAQKLVKSLEGSHEKD